MRRLGSKQHARAKCLCSNPFVLLQDDEFRASPGGLTCDKCPKGYDTEGTGNYQCDPCQTGYFNGKPGMDCQAAPAGTYTNTSAAWFPIPW